MVVRAIVRRYADVITPVKFTRCRPGLTRDSDPRAISLSFSIPPRLIPALFSLRDRLRED